MRQRVIRRQVFRRRLPLTTLRKRAYGLRPVFTIHFVISVSRDRTCGSRAGTSHAHHLGSRSTSRLLPPLSPEYRRNARLSIYVRGASAQRHRCSCTHDGSRNMLFPRVCSPYRVFTLSTLYLPSYPARSADSLGAAVSTSDSLCSIHPRVHGRPGALAFSRERFDNAHLKRKILCRLGTETRIHSADAFFFCSLAFSEVFTTRRYRIHTDASCVEYA